MSQFRNLVFEGGGVKGIAYAGAIQVLENEGILPDIRRVAGASAGAITAALLAIGASAADIEEIVGQTQFRKFMDDSFGVIRDIDRLIHDFGWFKGDAFSSWIKKQIYALSGAGELTFRELQERGKSKDGRCRELYVVGTNLSTQLEQVYSAENTPDVPIWQAVRVSMSIPLFFAAVKTQGDVLVDGGVTWNYPIDLFDDKRFKPAKGAGDPVEYPTKYDNNHIYNKETLGFRVDTKDEIKAEKDRWRRPSKPIENFLDYSGALVGFVLDMANKAHLHTNDWHRTVFIDGLGVRTTEFNLTDQQVSDLVQSGVTGATQYFAWFNDAKSDPKNRV